MMTSINAIERFKRNEFVVACSTNMEVVNVLNCFDRYGITWASGDRIWEHQCWQDCKTRKYTCFEFPNYENGIKYDVPYHDVKMERYTHDGRWIPVMKGSEFLRGVKHDDIY